MRIINDILDISKLESGSFELSMCPLIFVTCFGRSLMFIDLPQIAKGLKIQLEFRRDCPIALLSIRFVCARLSKIYW